MKKRILSMITALALSLSLLPTTALATAEEGAEAAGSVYESGTQMQDGENEETKHTHTGQTYTALESENNKIELSAGNYYLLEDLSVAETLTITKEVNLCLNGHTLSLADGTMGSLFQIGDGGKLTLCDCEGKGKLVGNDDGGSVVTVASGGTFDMYGGMITGAKATSGGGVYVGGTFILNGGKISGNHSTNNGGGVYVNSNGTFTVNGGVISDNTGSGYDSSGAPYVKPSNVYIDGDGPFTVGTSLHEDTMIYVDHPKDTVFTNEGVAAAVEHFKSSDADLFVVTTDTGALKVVGAERLPKHTHNTSETYTALVSNGNLELSDGKYYLFSDLSTVKTFTITDEVNLCLNGHTLSLAAGAEGPLFQIEKDGKLTLCDCEGGGKLASNNDGGSVVTVASNGIFDMYGGTITGATATSGGGVYVGGESSIFTMHGGTISGNTAENGGGVHLNGGTFTMHGGTISGNEAQYGGGVYVEKGAFIMDGGTIGGNEAQYGGGVYMFNDEDGPVPQFFMYDGTISGNTAAYDGGGVFAGTRSVFLLQGNATITGNTSDRNGGGVHVAGGQVIMDDGTLSGNEAQYGGGVYLNDGKFDMNSGEINGNEAQSGGGVAAVGGTFTVYNGTISGNTAANTGGGVYVDSDNSATFTVAGGKILNNKKGSAGASNVYVVGGAPFTVENSLPNATEIYVDHGIGAVFTNAGLAEGTDTYFKATDRNLVVVRNVENGALEIAVDTTKIQLHEHDKEEDSYSPLVNNTINEIKEAGKYYLHADLQMAQTVTISAPVNLCLNGHELVLKSGEFQIGEGGTLTLCDCKGGGRIVGAVSNTGTFYVYGGTLSEIALENGGKVYLAAGAKFADDQLTVSFKDSEQIHADPALLSNQKMALHLDESVSTVPSGAVVKAWTADGSDASFTSVDNFTLVRLKGYKLELKEGDVVLTDASSGSTGGSSGGRPSGGSPGSRPGSGGGGGGSSKPSTPPESITVPISGEENTIHVGVSVIDDKAVINEVDLNHLDTVIGDQMEDVGTVMIDFSNLESKEPITTVELPANVVKEIGAAVNDPANDAQSLKIVLANGLAIEFDAVALGEKAAQADGMDITISIRPGKEARPNQKQEAALKGRPAYDITVTSGGEHISDMGGKITIYAPYELQDGEHPEGIVVWYVDEDGKQERCETAYDPVKKLVSWKTDHLSLYMIDYEENIINPFADVSEDMYFFDAVLWAYEQGITGGTGADTFSPDASCTRAQMATFLWRAAGSPEPADSYNPFTDVTADAYYAKAVQWAVEQGITAGTSATTFSPDMACTRAQMAAFLYRMEQVKGGGFTGAWMFYVPFTDAPEWAFESIAWCYMKGITSGTAETTFSPDENCTRGQMVTFLYRYFAK